MRLMTNLIFSLNLIFISFITADDVGDECTPNASLREGICTVTQQCEPAVRALKKQQQHGFQRCGFDGFQEIVCCPVTTPKFGDLPKTNDNAFESTRRIVERECRKILETSVPPLDLHILGGEMASLGEFPQMAGLGFDRGNGYTFECGGSLLSDRYLLTAAHCVDTIDQIQPTMVRMGVIDIGSEAWNDETDHQIAELILHPNYTRREKYNDLALVRLQNPVTFSSNLNPVCLDTDMEDPVGPLTVTGWGKTSNTRDVRSRMLLKTNVTVVATSRCGQSYTNWRKLPQGIISTQLCAGDSTSQHDTCQGDSGGPLLKTGRSGEYMLVGVTSFGRGCGSTVPGVYTRVAAHLPWIQSLVWPR